MPRAGDLADFQRHEMVALPFRQYGEQRQFAGLVSCPARSR